MYNEHIISGNDRENYPGLCVVGKESSQQDAKRHELTVPVAPLKCM